MGKDGSVAPKERINIKYVPATGDQQEEVELPLRVVVLGDFLGRDEEGLLEDVKMLSVDKNSFNSVLEEAELERSITVQKTLDEEDEDATLSVELKIKSLKDFEPDSIVRQVPELAKMSQLREALVALKGPLGNMPSFRKRIETLLEDEANRDALLTELESVDAENSAEGVSDVLEAVSDDEASANGKSKKSGKAKKGNNSDSSGDDPASLQ